MSQTPTPRVAVTGLGALSPGGVGLERYRAWRAGGGGEGRVPSFDPTHYVANPKLLRSMQRTFQLVAAASVLAMRGAGLASAEGLGGAGVSLERAGIAAALTDLSPLTRDLLETLAEAAPGEAAGGAPDGAMDWGAFSEAALHRLHPFRRLTLLANMAVAHTSLLFGLQGPSFTFTSGAAAGVQAIDQAYWTIAEGRADLMLCVSAESPEQTFSAQPPPETAGAMVLESWALAQRRGAPVLAELGEELAMSTELGRTASPVAGFLSVLLRIEPTPQRFALGETS